LPRLNGILALKELGLSLEQIGPLLKDKISPTELRAMLTLKRAEVERSLRAEETRLRHIDPVSRRSTGTAGPKVSTSSSNRSSRHRFCRCNVRALTRTRWSAWSASLPKTARDRLRRRCVTS
jgi:DNA-binding transcriptional MerR regulator